MRGPVANRSNGHVQTVRELVCSGRGKPGESARKEDGAGGIAKLHPRRKHRTWNIPRQTSSGRSGRYVSFLAKPLEGAPCLSAGTRTLSARLSRSRIGKHSVRVLLGKGKFRTQAHASDRAGCSLSRSAR